MDRILTRQYYSQPAWITILVNAAFLGVLVLAGIWDIFAKSKNNKLAKLGKLLYSIVVFTITIGVAVLSINCTMVGVKGGGSICKIFAWLNAIFMILTPILFTATIILSIFTKFTN